MSFRTRKRGTPRQIGKKFPVQEKKKLPPKIRLHAYKEHDRIYAERALSGQEILGWLRKNPDATFAVNRWSYVKENQADVTRFVKQLKALGAVKITVNPEYEQGKYTDTMFAFVPISKSKIFEKVAPGMGIDEFTRIASVGGKRIYRLWWD